MESDVITPAKVEHPSKLQRKKLEEVRKERLTKALRENLRKRKEQVKNRNNKG